MGNRVGVVTGEGYEFEELFSSGHVGPGGAAKHCGAFLARATSTATAIAIPSTTAKQPP